MKNRMITQRDLIKRSFINYYIRQYRTDGPNKPIDEVYEILTRPDYHNELVIDGLSKHPNSPDSPLGGTPRDYRMATLSSVDIAATNHHFTPMGVDDDLDTYKQEVTKIYDGERDTPYLERNRIFLLQEASGDLKFKMYLDPELFDLPESELRQKVIDIFLESTVVEFIDGETVGGIKQDFKEIFKFSKEEGLTIDSPAVTGNLSVIRDERKMIIDKPVDLGVIKLREEEVEETTYLGKVEEADVGLIF